MKKFLLIAVIFLLNSTELRPDKKKCIENLLKYGVSNESINGFIKIADSLDSYSQSTIPQILHYMINCYSKFLNEQVMCYVVTNEIKKCKKEIDEVFTRSRIDVNSPFGIIITEAKDIIIEEILRCNSDHQMKVNILKEFYMMYYPTEEKNTVILGGYDMGKFLPKFE